MKTALKVLLAIIGTVIVVAVFVVLFFGLMGGIVFLAAHKIGAWILATILGLIVFATAISLLGIIATEIYRWADDRWPGKNQ